MHNRDDMPNGVAYTNVGGRENNEDVFLADIADGCLLLAVADGLGGAEAGEAASGAAKETLRKLFEAAPKRFDLSAAIIKANEEIIALQKASRKTMKTTAAALYINGGTAVCGHVGDTRIYLFGKDGTIFYQSVDHSVSQMFVYTGEITLNEIRGHGDRNLLTKALGNGSDCEPDIREFPAREIHAALLCSDGFWEYVYEEEMGKLLRENDDNARKWLAAMKKTLRERQPEKCDNNTAIAVIF